MDHTPGCILRPCDWLDLKTVSASRQKIRILIVDDHPVVRKGLQSCLSRHEQLKVVGEAEDGVDALQKARTLMPDVILTDISMPKMDGLTMAESMRRELPAVRILVLTVHSNKDFILRIIKAGAHGYVSKEAPTDTLVKAIETIHQGHTYFSPEIAQAALTQLVANGGKENSSIELTEREREVLVLIAEGQSNKEIANHLGIGVRTIETHRERIMRRLDIHSVAGLTKYAISTGLISLDGTAKS
jgi:two-component system, NarL family, nitrate/nitrite response regulator NarL